jgi:signal transduction histidine kinase/DNA-binding response OmpR family regulator/CHASE3 domain sensor protein
MPHRTTGAARNRAALLESSLPLHTLLGFLLAITAVVVILILSLRSLNHQSETREGAIQGLRVLSAVQEVLTSLQDAETGQRGYLLTGESVYLEPYQRGIGLVPGRLDELRRLVGDDPETLRDVDDLARSANDKIAELAETIQMRESGRAAEALALVRTDRGKVNMDRVRELVAKLAGNQQRTVDELYERVQEASGRSFAIVLGGLGALLILILASVWSAMRDVRVRGMEAWLRAGQADLGTRLQGEQRLSVLGENVLGYLAERLGAAVGAFYVDAGHELRCHAGFALNQSPKDRPALRRGEGLAGEALSRGQAVFLHDVPSGYLDASSATGEGRPVYLAVLPTTDGDVVNGVIELGFFRQLDENDREYLRRAAEVAGAAVGGSQDRERLEALLEETQRQAEELQTQQEELRVANEELEEHGRILTASKAQLESQQVELEQTNAQLEDQAERLAQGQAALQEKASELARSSQYKSEFLANMSHELRTPLNSSLILAKLLSDNKPGNLTEDQVRFAQTILAAGNDLLALINDILDLSKIEAGHVEIHPEPVEVNGLVDSLIQLFDPIAKDKQLGFSHTVDPRVPARMETDAPRLTQILKNLLSNAFKFTENGGVTLAVAAEEGVDGQWLRFDVTDSGIGIPPEKIDVIFDAFRQADGSTHRRYGGTGLGLSISRDLARLLGGEIEVRSELGRGSTFSLRLPARSTRRSASTVSPRSVNAVRAELQAVASGESGRVDRRPDAQLTSAGVADDRDAVRGGGRNLLIIEDDQDFATILRDLAHELQFEAIVTHTATDGLAAARRFPVTAIILDMSLPDRTGLAVLDELKRDPATRHVPVHIVSVTDYSQEALSRGAVGYALKPVKRDELAEALRLLESQFAQRLRRVLIVEDDERQRSSIAELLAADGVEIVGVKSAAEALTQLETVTFDCMVLDLTLPDMSGYELLDRMGEGDLASFPPVIVYTGRVLSRDEELRLRRYSRSIIIKDVRSPERLLDEVSLFLHQVESSLPSDKQRLLRAARSRDAAFDGRRVLIVEDDVRNIFAVSKVLEPLGMLVDIARNGREALELLAKKATAGEVPDVVLMDIMMPEMDGLTATRAIRAQPQFKRLPIIALTAKAMQDDQQSCIAAGANDYIAKPLDVERLLSLLRVWLPR